LLPISFPFTIDNIQHGSGISPIEMNGAVEALRVAGGCVALGGHPQKS
jgi:hypothetical protein